MSNFTIDTLKSVEMSEGCPLVAVSNAFGAACLSVSQSNQ